LINYAKEKSTNNSVGLSLIPEIEPVIKEKKQVDGQMQKVIVRNIQTGVLKLNLFARQIRGLHVNEAMAQMQLSPKMKSKIVLKAIKHGINLFKVNQKIEPTHLYIHEAYVTRGFYLKKMDIKGRGRQGVMYKPRSHLNLVLVQNFTPKTKMEKEKDKFLKYLNNTTVKFKKVRSFP